ncbi:MAG: serine--tRNA ligase [SAR324 cluster bacterium]|nr:serine--tRNA ligase [SAR324 cluster bacterium]MBL7035496.1 serine--tRNA ligase [SAR324 cluster bacterium]
MLDLKLIRNQPEEIAENCRKRNVQVDLEKLLELDTQVRQLTTEVDSVRQRRNEISNKMKSKISPDERQPLIEEAKKLRDEESEKETLLREFQEQRLDLQKQIPNLTHPDSPEGLTDEDNIPIRQVGTVPEFDFEPKDHLELMENLDLIDFDGGAKVSGQKFYYLKNQAVFLELALAQYALNLLQNEGFTVHITPDLARQQILDGIGFNPRGAETQIYSVEDSELCLIATAEITLGGLMMDKVLKVEDLPIMYAGLSHCYRTEAGAAGRESRGLYRVHQFSKIEMFAFTHPEKSGEMHENMREIEEKIYQELGIPYQLVNICTGDLGGPAYRKYDLEAWMPGRGKWGEVTSTSNCTDYQSRRMNIRFKDADTGKNRFVHMLNGTAIAVSRTLIALIENGQQKDGSIKLPPCLNIPDIRAKKVSK